MDGRYKDSNNLCKVCPSSLTNCLTCKLDYTTNSAKCLTCVTGYYLSGNNCIRCPNTCPTCSLVYYNSNYLLNCTTCASTLTRTGGPVYSCGCNSNQYLTTTPSCVNCPTGCAMCTGPSTCSSCSNGYYLSGSSCLQCMPVCSRCTTGTTCTHCRTGLSLSGSVCRCNSPLLLQPGTLTCVTCASQTSNCATCGYQGGSYNPSAPTAIVCTVANPGYYILSGTATQCGSNCQTCNSNTDCTLCSHSSFTLSPAPGSCYCNPTLPTPLYLSTVGTCLPCPQVISGCMTCVDVSGTTRCSACQNGFYSLVVAPFSTCTACMPTCFTCLNESTCSNCKNNLFFDNATQTCICTGGLILRTSTTTC